MKRLVLILLAAACAAPAAANRGAVTVFNYSGRPGDSSFTCASCHREPLLAAPTVTVTGLDDLVAGETATVLLTITSAHDSPAQRIAGFVATTDDAGVFTNHGTSLLVNRCDLGNGIRPPAPAQSNAACDGDVPCPSFFGDGGEVTYELVLEDLQPGEHTLYVGANDADNNRVASNDKGVATSFPFTVAGEGEGERSCDDGGVGEGEGEGEGDGGGGGGGEDPPGCVCVSGGSADLPLGGVLFGLALFGLRRIRLRAGQ